MNCLAKNSEPCPYDRPWVLHACLGAPTSAGQCACSVCATWPELYNMPPPDRSFAGRRGEKTFAVRGEHPRPPVRIEGTMLWRTHAQTVRCVHSCLALYENKVSRTVHSCPALYENKVSRTVDSCPALYDTKCREQYIRALEHVPYSVRGSTIMHVASARVRPILLSCAWCETRSI